MRRPRYALLSGLSVLITCFFAASYANADIGRYYLGPVLFAWTWLAMLAATILEALGVGMDDRLDDDPAEEGGRAEPLDDDGSVEAPAGPRPGRTLLDPRAAGVGLSILVAALLLVPTALDAPVRFERVDRSTDTSARRWLDRVMAAMEPDAVIVSWWSYSTPLWYAQRVEGLRPDIAIIDDRTRLDEGLGSLTDVIDAHLGSRPVYVIRLDRREIRQLEDRYVLDTIDGNDASGLTRVVSLREAAS